MSAVYDLANFQYRAQSYVRAKGWRGPEADDIASEMVLEALEHPDKMLDLDYVYLHALDKLDPRRRQGNITHGRQSQRLLSLDAPLDAERYADEQRHWRSMAAQKTWYDVRPAHCDEPFAEVMDAVPPAGRLRAILLLYGVYGYTMKEVAFLFGITESRVSQILSEAREAALAEPGAVDLAWRVQWLTL